MVASEPFSFKPIQQPSVVDQIIEHFKHALLTGELHPGQKLPSEPEMAKQFGASRGAVREAMKVLEALGVVHIRQGSGTHIATTVSDKMFNPLAFNIILGAQYSIDLIELRLMLQIGYCELAAQAATAEDWERIEAAAHALEDAAAHPEANRDELARLDIAFHFALLDATHNSLVIKMGRTVEELFFASIRDTFRLQENILEATEVHRGIINALHLGDPVSIRAAVINSLLNTPWRKEVRIFRPGTSETSSETTDEAFYDEVNHVE